MFFELVGPPDVGLSGFASAPGFSIQDDGGSRLGHEEKMQGLHGGAEEQLDPEIPAPCQILLHKPTGNGADDRSTHGGEDHKGHGVLLVIRLPHVGDHAQGHGAARRGDAAEEATHDDGGKVGCQRTRDLPDIHQHQTELQHRPSPQLLAPRGPEFTAKGVGDEEDHLADAGILQADVEVLGQRRNGVGVDAGVEVHGALHGEDDAQDGPFLPAGIAEAELLVAIVVSKLNLPVGPLTFGWIGSFRVRIVPVRLVDAGYGGVA